MRGNDVAATLADKNRMLHLLGVADLHDVVDDVTGILVEGVVPGAVKAGTGAVVVDPEPASDIKVAERVAHLAELRVEARGLAGRTGDGGDVRHL